MLPSPFYQCSVDIVKGTVSTLRKTDTKGNRNKSTGYYTVNLKETNSKKFSPVYVHRLIWETANGIKVPGNMHIHHLDSVKSNNSINNLSAVTCKLNNWFAAKNRDYTKILEKRRENGFKVQVVATDTENNKLRFKSMRETARHFGCNVGTVSKILSGNKYYNHILSNDKKYTFVRA